jgi:hypothetical protein
VEVRLLLARDADAATAHVGTGTHHTQCAEKFAAVQMIDGQPLSFANRDPQRESLSQSRYREFVGDGLASRPWDDLKGQIYLGSKAFIERHAPRQKVHKGDSARTIAGCEAIAGTDL